MKYDELTADTIYEEDAKMILSHAFDDAIKAKKWDLGVQIFINLTASEFNSKDLARIIAITEKFDTLRIPSETRLLRFARQRAKGIHSLANGNIEEAITHFKKQADFIDPLLDVQRYKVQVFADLAECQRFTNNSNLELKFLLKIDSIALTENLTDLRLSSARQLAKFYSEKGNTSMAKLWSYRYFTLRDSIYPSGVPTLRDHPSMRDEITRINARQIENTSSKISLTFMVIIVLALLAILIIVGLCFAIRRRSISQHNTAKDMCKNSGSQFSEIIPETSRKYRTSPLQDKEKLHLAETITRCLSENNEIYSSDFSLGRLAELCNSRPSYVSQIINECLNKNFNTLLNSYRIQEACKRMNEKGVQAYTIESISLAVGFKSRSSFVAAFKKETGMTPSEYLKTNLKG